MVIEDAGHTRLRHRRLALALAAGAGALAAAATVWWFGWALGAFEDLTGLVGIAAVAHLAGGSLLRDRARRADFQLRPAVVLTDGVRPAFVAARSRIHLALEAVAAAALLLAMVFPGGARIAAGDLWWRGFAYTAGGVLVALVVAHQAYRVIRYPGLVLTADGVVMGRRLVRWDELASVRRERDGLVLRLKGSKEVSLDGNPWQVSTDRIQQVIEHFRQNPHHRPSAF